MGFFDFMGKMLFGIILIILTLVCFIGFMYLGFQQKLGLAYTVLGFGLLSLVASIYFIKQAKKVSDS